MKNLLLYSFILYSFFAHGNTATSIESLRNPATGVSFLNTAVQVEGIVTGVFQGSNQIGGFFIQNEKGIFVEHTATAVAIGDKVSVQGTVKNQNNRLQISSVSNVSILSSTNTLPITQAVFPDDFSSMENYEGMLLELNQTMVVTDNYRLLQYGQLTLSSERLYSPTHQGYPASSEYYQTLSFNNDNQLYLDDASTASYPTNNPFLDINDTRRTGEKVDNVHLIVDQIGDYYYVYAPQSLDFYGNPRSSNHPEIGNYSLKVCGTNLEMFKTSNWGDGFGADNSTQFARQRTKILVALNTINADIYGITEIQQGSDALQNLVNGLNALRGSNDFAFINDRDNVSGYIKSGFIYNRTKVTPYLSVVNNNNISSTRFRKKAQTFIENSTNEKLIVVVNHYKAKSGCPTSGVDADQNDGQSCYNYTRMQEAIYSLSFIDQMMNYAKDADVLFLGDLNSYKKEDPITTLLDGGMIDLLETFQGNETYSYVYRGNAGYLDYALSTPSMHTQATGATPFHLNSDEPSLLSYDNATYYQPNMFRYSDHDPILVGVKLTKQALFEPSDKIQLFHDWSTNIITLTRAKNCDVHIMSSCGRNVYYQELPTDLEEIHTHFLPAGVYIVKISGAKEDTFKFIQL